MIKIRSASIVAITSAALWLGVNAQVTSKGTVEREQPQSVTQTVTAREGLPSDFSPMKFKEPSFSSFVRSVSDRITFRTAKENEPQDKSLSFIASITSSDSDIAPGIYLISTSGNYTLLGASADNNAKGGGVLVGDTYYTVAQTSLFGMTAIRGQDWKVPEWTKIMPYNWSLELKYVATDVTYDPTTGNIYGCYYNEGGNGYEFGTAVYEMNSKKRESICALEYPLNAVASDTQGNIYGIDMEGNLQSIEKSTGAMTLVGSTGFIPEYVSSGAIDKKTGRMYWVVSPQEGGSFLCEVSLTDGHATKICDFPGGIQITGMFFPDDKAHPDAPDTVEGLAINFPEGSLSGTVDFKMPTLLYSGEQITGDLRYRVYVNGEKVSEAASQPGANVSAPVSVSAPENYDIEVVAVNATGEGPSAKMKVFIGTDTPVTPSAINVEYADGAFQISWEPATVSANGGYLDPEKISYNLYRMPDNVTVTEGGKATSYTDEFEAPEELTSYWYSMQVLYDGTVCGSNESAHHTLGAILPPYLQTFDDASAMDGYTIIDGNNDKRKWYVYNGEAAVSFNDKTPKDDWLITPAIKLEKGKVYKFSIDVRANVDFYPETFCIMMGTEPTAEGMTETLVPETTVIKPGITASEFIPVSEDGLYYIGLHAITPEGPSMFYADNLTISAAIDGETPEAVNDLEVTATGYRTASIAFHAPSKSANGTELESIDKIDILRNGEVVKTFDAPAPGAALSHEDTVEEAGEYTYSIVSHNLFGAGTPAETTLYIGVPKPYRPGIATVHESAPGEVTLTWEPSEADEAGNPIDAQYMRYYVVELNGEEQIIVGDKVEGTTFTYTPMPDPQYQKFMQFAVFAVTEGGVSMGVVTELIPVGLSYTVPFRESFSDIKMHGIWGTAISAGQPEWGLYSDVAIQDVTSADSDNGFIGMRGKQGGEIAMLYSGKIDLAGVANPALTFQTYNIKGKDDTGKPLPADTNDVQVFINAGNGWDNVLSSTVDELCNGVEGWAPVLVDLNAYKGKNIQVGFMCSSKIFLFTLFDAIKVLDLKDKNMTALAAYAPKYAVAGNKFTVKGVVENNGRLTADSYVVSLSRNGEKINEQTCQALDFGRNMVIQFTDMLDGTCDEDNVYTIAVDLEGDEVPADNESGEVAVMMKTLVDPMVRNLSASTEDGNNVTLTWDEPDFTSAPPALKRDGFEEYKSWANSHVGDWVFADLDKGKIGSLNYINFPNIPTGSQQSFWVLDDTLEDIANYTGGNWRYRAFDGHKYLAQAFVAEQLQCDDWAISPLLYGGEQCVTLYAKSFMAGMPESFEFLVSDTGNAVEDFELLEACDAVPDTWTEYCFNIPEGSKYFAVRCVSKDRFMFFFDAVSFIPAGSPRELNLVGYNVYRNGKKVNDTPVTETKTTDNPGVREPQTVKYAVTAVYAGSESKAQEVSMDVSSVGQIFAGDLNIFSKAGMICLRNVAGSGVTVSSLDGAVIYSAGSANNLDIPVSAGVYIVKAGTKAVKLIVR